MRPSISPVQEAYKNLLEEDRILMKRFDIEMQDLTNESYFRFMLNLMKRIERLENANLSN